MALKWTSWGILLGTGAHALQLPIDVTQGCSVACSHLVDIFGPSAVHFPNNDSGFHMWDGKQDATISACRVEPENALDVAEVLGILINSWCTFAIKGGGHSRARDASKSVGGVTIDMGRMANVVFAEDRQSAWVGPGQTLIGTYRALEPYNLTQVGGRVDSVGMAGYTMGGGFSNINQRVGLAVDNVLEFEVVLPDGRMANVSRETHPDLYYALRGGANNFGIVTNFRIRVYEQGQQLFGTRVYKAEYIDDIMDEVHKLGTTFSNDTNISYWTRYAYNQTTDKFIPSVTLAYLEPIENPPIFDSINSIPYESSSMKVDWFSNHISKPVPFGLRHLFTTVTYTISAVMDRRLCAIFKEEVASVKTIPSFLPGLVIQTIPTKVFEVAQERGGNALGLESPTGQPLGFALLTFGWSNSMDDEAMYAFAERWRSRAEEAAKGMGLWNRWLYINYCKEDQDPFAGYGKDNKMRLQSIQRETDPKGFFTEEGLNRGYFKLN